MSACSPTTQGRQTRASLTESQKSLKWFQIEMISIFIPVPLETPAQVLAL
jgi:hypothetical protein